MLNRLLTLDPYRKRLVVKAGLSLSFTCSIDIYLSWLATVIKKGWQPCLHSVRKWQIVSKNSIFRKSKKMWIWVFAQILMINRDFYALIFNKILNFRAKKLSKFNHFQFFQFCFWTKSRFLARKFKLFRHFLHLKILKNNDFLAEKFKFRILNFSENWIFGQNLW